MGLTWPTDTDDDGSGTTGTVHDNSWLQSLKTAILAWVVDSYTPTWSGTSVTVGNATLSGSSFTIGAFVAYRSTLVVGSTSTVGSVNRLTIPSTATAALGGFGMITISDVSAGGAVYAGQAVLDSTTTVQLLRPGSPLADITSTTPITFATGDIINVLGFYFKA